VAQIPLQPGQGHARHGRERQLRQALLERGELVARVHQAALHETRAAGHHPPARQGLEDHPGTQ
jgi:hypothetical protein